MEFVTILSHGLILLETSITVGESNYREFPFNMPSDQQLEVQPLHDSLVILIFRPLSKILTDLTVRSILMEMNEKSVVELTVTKEEAELFLTPLEEATIRRGFFLQLVIKLVTKCAERESSYTTLAETFINETKNLQNEGKIIFVKRICGLKNAANCLELGDEREIYGEYFNWKLIDYGTCEEARGIIKTKNSYISPSAKAYFQQIQI